MFLPIDADTLLLYVVHILKVLIRLNEILEVNTALFGLLQSALKRELRVFLERKYLNYVHIHILTGLLILLNKSLVLRDDPDDRMTLKRKEPNLNLSRDDWVGRNRLLSIVLELDLEVDLGVGVHVSDLFQNDLVAVGIPLQTFHLVSDIYHLTIFA